MSVNTKYKHLHHLIHENVTRSLRSSVLINSRFNLTGLAPSVVVEEDDNDSNYRGGGVYLFLNIALTN